MESFFLQLSWWKIHLFTTPSALSVMWVKVLVTKHFNKTFLKYFFQHLVLIFLPHFFPHVRHHPFWPPSWVLTQPKIHDNVSSMYRVQWKSTSRAVYVNTPHRIKHKSHKGICLLKQITTHCPQFKELSLSQIPVFILFIPGAGKNPSDETSISNHI